MHIVQVIRWQADGTTVREASDTIQRVLDAGGQVLGVTRYFDQLEVVVRVPSDAWPTPVDLDAPLLES